MTLETIHFYKHEENFSTIEWNQTQKETIQKKGNKKRPTAAGVPTIEKKYGIQRVDCSGSINKETQQNAEARSLEKSSIEREKKLYRLLGSQRSIKWLVKQRLTHKDLNHYV